MSPIRPSRISSFLDSLTGWHLISAVIVLTFSFAAFYFCISHYSPSNGLIDVDNQDISLTDALYFSIVTEATLGYGDIRPAGWARLLACCQVMMGLVLAGMAVAKITSLPGRELRLATAKACGDWIELNRVADGRVMVSFSTIFIAGNVLRCDGENFHSDGKPWGFFKSELMDVDGSFLRFRYSNRESLTEEFVEGINSVQFIPDASGQWVRAQATVHDFGKKQSFTYEIFRATAEELAIIHSTDYDARNKLVERIADRWQSKNPKTLEAAS